MARERDFESAPAEDPTIVDLEGRSAPAFREGMEGEPPDDLRTDVQAALFPPQEADDFRKRWELIQAGFVDEPRRAVEDADALVAAAMERLTNVFAEERSHLEGQWDRGDEVSTEDLRLSLQRYRSFFGRLLSV